MQGSLWAWVLVGCWGEPIYNKNVVIYAVCFIHNLLWVYLRFSQATFVSSDTGLYVFKHMCGKANTVYSSCLLPFLIVQPLAILPHILCKLKHYIGGDYVLYIIVKKCICNALSIVNILSQQSFLFFFCWQLCSNSFPVPEFTCSLDVLK